MRKNNDLGNNIYINITNNPLKICAVLPFTNE